MHRGWTCDRLTIGLLLYSSHLSIAGIAQADPNAGHGKADVPMMDAKFPTMSAKYGMGVTPFNLVFLEILEIVVEENSTRTLVPVKIDFAFDRV